tara:strand:- start:223 stop:471 length:249 start_codon:yes stop_codon:yes gene_type:complete
MTKGYDHWLAAFEGLEERRDKDYGIRTLYRGQDLQEADTFHLVMFTPSMEVLQSHMENEAVLIAEAGGDPDPDANTMSISSD